MLLPLGLADPRPNLIESETTVSQEAQRETIKQLGAFSTTALRKRWDHALLVSIAVSLAQDIWFTGELYVAGTSNHRLCMYRMLNIL